MVDIGDYRCYCSRHDRRDSISQTSSPSTEGRAKTSVAMKKVWQDPEYQAKMKVIRKKQWEDPEYRAKMRTA
ncbi:unnamed protein product [marine sediment metagenome]|uniref:Uncharacterized protein n=1 Tax=marine sediment metagenome TaxID=412755 RepID=X1M620_9ZZZZ